MPKCFHCEEELTWQNDYDMEDIDPDSEYLLVSMYQCPKCDGWYEFYHGNKEEDMGIWN
jgi:hypothetical protein